MSDFTVQDYRQLGEALDRNSGNLRILHEGSATDIALIESAARRFLDRYQICQTCDGDGFFLPSGNHSLAELANMKGEDCDDCVGGLVPNQERLGEKE